jgi:hypothetical protein
MWFVILYERDRSNDLFAMRRQRDGGAPGHKRSWRDGQFAYRHEPGMSMDGE